MAFKRKRSDDDSPRSISSYGGAVSTPEAQSPTPFPHSFDGSMDLDIDTSRHLGWDFASASRVKSSDWGNRTRKRFRDNRPDERSIHENTLNKLFAAQRNHLDTAPSPSEGAPVEQPAHAAPKPQKSTLHSFWKQLPAPPVETLACATQPQPHRTEANASLCDDCDTPLHTVNDSMDIDMDVDMDGATEGNPFACIDCGKNVCGTCAVVSTRRHCLQCATSGRNSRRWW